MGEVKRQIRYNVETDTAEQVTLRHRWTIMIYNEPREIERIRERIYRQFQPLDDVRDLLEMGVPKSRGLHALVFSFSSNWDRFRNKEEIYDSPHFYPDRDLAERDEQAIINYVERRLNINTGDES